MSERRLVRGLGEVYDISNPIVARFGERVMYGQQMQELTDPFNYLNEVSERIKEGAYPVFYSNHNQHLNISGFREVIAGLPVRPENLYVAVAIHWLTKDKTQKLLHLERVWLPFLLPTIFT